MGASEDRLTRRIADLRSLAPSDPALASTPLRAGTSLDQLRAWGPHEAIFPPVLGGAGPQYAWLKGTAAAEAA